MSEYRNPNDPFPSDMRSADTRSSNGMWGWIAGAVFVVIILAIAFGVGRQPDQQGSNRLANNTPPAANKVVPPLAPAPSGPANPALNPAPQAPAEPNPAAPR